MAIRLMTILLALMVVFCGCGKDKKDQTEKKEKKSDPGKTAPEKPEKSKKTETSPEKNPQKPVSLDSDEPLKDPDILKPVSGTEDGPSVEPVSRKDAKAAQVNVEGLLKYSIMARKAKDRFSTALMCVCGKDRERIRALKLNAQGVLTLLGVPKLAAREYSVGDVSRVGDRLKVDVVLKQGKETVRKCFYLSESGFQWQVELFTSAFSGPAAAVPDSTYKIASRVFNKDLVVDCVEIVLNTQEAEEIGGFEKVLLAGSSRAPSRQAASLILANFDNAIPEAKPMLMKTLGNLGGPEALKKILSLMQDKDEKTQAVAFQTLCAWKGPEAADHLMKIGGSDEKKRPAALSAYTRIAGRFLKKKPDKTLSMYKQAFAATKSDKVKKNIVGALANIHTLPALNEAKKHMSDKKLGGTAAWSAAKIAGRIWRKHEKEAMTVLNQLAKSKDRRLSGHVKKVIKNIKKARAKAKKK